MQIVELANGEIVGHLAGQDGLIHSVSVSSDGSLVAAANGGAPGCTGTVWEMSSKKSRFQFSGHFARFVDGTGHLLVGGENDEVQLLDSTDGRVLHEIAGHTKVTQSIAASKNGGLVLSGSWDGSVKLWSGAAVETKPAAAVAPFDAATAKQHQ